MTPQRLSPVQDPDSGSPTASSQPVIAKSVITKEDWVAHGLILLIIGWLLVLVGLPRYQILSGDFVGSSGSWLGWANYQRDFGTPRLADSFLWA